MQISAVHLEHELHGTEADGPLVCEPQETLTASARPVGRNSPSRDDGGK